MGRAGVSASARLLDAVFRERPATLEGAVRLSKFLGLLSFATTQYRFLRGDATSMVMLAGIVQLLFAVLVVLWGLAVTFRTFGDASLALMQAFLAIGTSTQGGSNGDSRRRGRDDEQSGTREGAAGKGT